MQDTLLGGGGGGREPPPRGGLILARFLGQQVGWRSAGFANRLAD